MVDVFAFFIIVTLVTIVAAAVVLWDVRRRLRRSFRRSTERALDDLAADTCDDLAGGGASDSRAVRRYEAVRDQAERASGVTELGKVAARAEVHRWTAKADAGLRQAKRRISGSKRSAAVVKRSRQGDRAPRSTRR